MAWGQEVHHSFGDGIDRRAAPNSPEYPPSAVWDMLNMVYERDNLDPEVMDGTTRIGTTAMGGAVTGLFDYDEGTRLIACCTDGKIYERSTADWAAATGGSGFNTTTTTRWSGCMYYGATTAANLLVFANGIDTPKQYDSTNGVAALGGSPPATGQFPVAFSGRMWLAAGATLFYSATNNAEEWSTGAGSIHVDRGSGDITGLYVFKGSLLIFKRSSILRILPGGGSLSETAIAGVSSSQGTVSHDTIRDCGSALLFLSDNGVQAIYPTGSSGGFRAENISSPVKPILDRRNRSATRTQWALFNEDRLEYYLQYPTSGTAPTEGIICNLAHQRKRVRWSRHDWRNLTAGCMYRSSGQEIQVVGNASGEVWQMHNGTLRASGPFTARLQTADYAQGAPGRMKQYGPTHFEISSRGNYPVRCNIVLGRAGMPSPYGSDEVIDDLGESGGWGVGTWGAELWGGQGEKGTYVRHTKVARGLWQRSTLSTTGGQWFKLHGMTINAKLGAAVIAA